jgi:UDP-N-acetylglucosamine 2-epimerase (non-hydrolysing)
MPNKLKILNIVGARPNFMKIAPLVRAMNAQPRIEHLLVHTGQHYDEKMSKSFFEDLDLPEPDINLGVGSGSHAEQTARIMVASEKIFMQEEPDLVIVVGDVNSTMACAITAKKLNIKVAHVEAGLRSHDMTMPEEINRLCTDVLSDYLFTTDDFANQNLFSEGVSQEKVFFVGNVMIDTLMTHLDKAKRLDVWRRFGVMKGNYVALTIHRPANVDERVVFSRILKALQKIAETLPIIFPIHPRTDRMLHSFGLQDQVRSLAECPGNITSGIWTCEPLGYLDFLSLYMNARLVLTDSGGLQEETSVLGIPCLTMRPNTERPITVTLGTNEVVGNDPDIILKSANDVLQGNYRKGRIPPKWDGKAGKRIVDILAREFSL